jgi:DNA repair and recombination protein RAD54B
MAGKEIGRATGFKLAQLQELENGKILKVGGREVFVCPFYLIGKLFLLN